MRLAHIFHAQIVAILSLLVMIQSGCGSSSSDGSASTPLATEVLYVKAPSVPVIMAYKIDPGSGYLTKIQTVTPPASNNVDSATILTVSPSGRFLYTDDLHSDGQTVTFRIDAYSIGPGGELSLVTGSPFGSPPVPTYGYRSIVAFAINPSNTTLYALDNGSNQGIARFAVDSASGALIANANVLPVHPESGFTGLAIEPGGKFLYLSEYFAEAGGSVQGSGISVFSINSNDGSLSAIEASPYVFPSHSGPEEMVFDPSNRFLYTNLANAGSSNDVAGFVRNQTTGALTPIPGSPFESESAPNPQAYSLAMHPTGKFLYVNNYNRGSITVFAVDQGTGVLTPIAGSPFPPQYSKRNTIPPQTVNGNEMAMDPSGNFLYLATSDSEIAIYRIDQSSGALAALRNSPMLVDASISAMTIVELR